MGALMSRKPSDVTGVAEAIFASQWKPAAPSHTPGTP